MLGKTEMDTLLADNGVNDITAAELRSVIDALISKARINDPPVEVDADDVYWDGSQVSSDFTTVTVSGSQTIVEARDVLSVNHAGQSTNDVNCVLKPYSWADGDWFATTVKLLTRQETGHESFAGIVCSDGTSTTSNALAVMTGLSSNLQNYNRMGGTLDSLTNQSLVNCMTVPGGHLWLGIEQVDSTTLRPHISIDGVSWDPFTNSDLTIGWTPTHIGVCWSKWGNIHTSTASFGPIVRIA